MNGLTTMIVLVITYLVSWFSARAAGRMWTESKIVGGMPRVMVIASLVLSTIGFTISYFMLILMIVPLFSSPFSGLDVAQFFPVSYGALGAAGVGAVPNLWLGNQVAARRQLLLGAMATQGGIALPIHPMDALNLTLRSRGLWGGAWNWLNGLGGGASGGKGGGKIKLGKGSGSLILILLVIALAVMALFAGVITTVLIVQSADRDHVGEIYEIYDSQLTPAKA
jgi:hypothetical protein